MSSRCVVELDEHDQNLNTFLYEAKIVNFIFKDAKWKFAKKSLHLLGFSISDNILKPDP